MFISGSVVTRATRSMLTATLTADKYFTLHHVEWAFTGGKGGTKNSGSNLSTSVVMVDSDNDYSVRVKVFSDATTEQCSSSAVIVVNPRTDPQWSLTPTVAPDNENRWGDLPEATKDDLVILGSTRDRKSDLGAILTPSPNSGRSWERGYRVVQVRDPGGPNDGYWYVSSAQFKIDMETTINRWIKPSGPTPQKTQPNWFSFNNQFCVNAASFLQAVQNHENSGSGPGSTGHFGLIRDTEASSPDLDANTAVERMFSATSNVELIMTTNDQLQMIDDTLRNAAKESAVVGNWPGSPGVSFWDLSLNTYSPCVLFMRAF